MGGGGYIRHIKRSVVCWKECGLFSPKATEDNYTEVFKDEIRACFSSLFAPVRAEERRGEWEVCCVAGSWRVNYCHAPTHQPTSFFGVLAPLCVNVSDRCF